MDEAKKRKKKKNKEKSKEKVLALTFQRLKSIYLSPLKFSNL